MPVTGIGLATAPDRFPTSSSASSTSSVAISSSSTVSIIPQTSTQTDNAINTSSAEAATAGTSFLQNKPAAIGVFAGVGVLVILILAGFVTCIRRRRRQRQQQDREMKLDREIDASYNTTMKQATDSWLPPAPVNPSMTHSRANSAYSTVSEASGSHPAYAQPPLPVTRQQNYDAAPQRDDEELSAKLSVAVRGTMVEPQIVQPKQARTHSPPGHAHLNSRFAQRPSQSADILISGAQPTTEPLPTIYLSHYALSPLPADSASVPYTSPTTELPITPTPFPNPFEQQQEQQQDQGKTKAMRPTSAALLSPSDLPITPTPFVNPFEQQQKQQQDRGKTKEMRPTSAALLSPSDMPITPTPFVNPFDQQQEREQDHARGTEIRSRGSALLSPADIPITPTPFPNPFDQRLQAKQVMPTTPVSPTPSLPNPYASDD
ncbi:hypothetical protein C8R45DRAFT_627300 [Mycena sanguinolenta]|nr:hypothetical protein C8R45DRAFT_627300 [Mycena sanguinolenta]